MLESSLRRLGSEKEGLSNECWLRGKDMLVYMIHIIRDNYITNDVMWC